MTQGRTSRTNQQEVELEAKPSTSSAEKFDLRNSAATEKTEKNAPELLRKSSQGTKRITRSDIIINALVPNLGKSDKTTDVSQQPATLFGVQAIKPIPEKPKRRNTKTRFQYAFGMK